MSIIKVYLSLIMLAALSTKVFAASYYCLETNQIVNEGDALERVLTVCGPPTHITIRDEILSKPVEIFEWVYINRPVDPTKTSNYLARLIVAFNNQGKVIQLKRSQIQDNSQPNVICDVGGVKVGDDMPTVHINCGSPAFINRLISSEEMSIKVVEWTYQKKPNVTPLAFRFENGILTQIKNG